YAFAPRLAALSRLESGALLHQAERWSAFFIKRYDFPVKDGALSFYELWQAAKLGELCGEVILAARHQTHAAVFDECDGAVTVPFNFKQPVRIVECLCGGDRQHWMDDCGHGPLLRTRQSFNRRGRRFRRRFLGL